METEFNFKKKKKEQMCSLSCIAVTITTINNNEV